MLNSNPSRSRGFTKGSRPFFTPRGSKIAPMCLLHILPSLASQKLNYKYIRVCGIQIIHISGFFIRITHFFTPRGFRKSPQIFFFCYFQEVLAENLVTSPLWHAKLKSNKIPGFFLRSPPFFTPGGFHKITPKIFFHLS